MKKIVFIMNPISGTTSKAKIPELIETTLDRELFHYELRLTEFAGHASEMAAEARDGGADMVVAVGGDGTVTRWHAHSWRARRHWESSPAALETGWPAT